MKKIFPLNDYSLFTGDSDLWIGKEFVAFKLTREQAIGFKFDETIEQMKEKYPPLLSGEMYEGFIAVWYNRVEERTWISVYRLKGILIRIPSSFARSYDEPKCYAVETGGCFEVGCFTKSGEYKRDGGLYSEVYCFSQTWFVDAIKEIQAEGRLAKDISPENLQAELRQKLIDCHIAQKPIEVSDEDYEVISRGVAHTYVGRMLIH